MITITRAEVEAILSRIHQANERGGVGITRDEGDMLARIVLASLQAEPVALRDERSGSGGISKKTGFNDLPHGTPLYTAPPAPVSVPDDVSGPLAHAYKELTPTFMRNHIGVFERYGIYPDGSAGIQAMRIALDGMNRRAAMLQSFGNSEQHNSPVIPEGWVACSERMPEGMTDVHISNGHDVGQGWWDGDTWQTQHDYYSVPGDVTHWMPLPTAPRQRG